MIKYKVRLNYKKHKELNIMLLDSISINRTHSTASFCNSLLLEFRAKSIRKVYNLI